MTERQTNFTFAALIVAAIVGALMLIIPNAPLSKEPVLGLDLQGGLEVVLKAVPPEGRPLQSSDLDRSVEIIRERIDKLGVAEPEVRKQGDDQISVELPGVRNADRARDIIGQTARLELYDLATALTGPSVEPRTFQAVPTETLYDLLSAPETTSLARQGEAGPFYLFERETKKRIAGPMPSREALLALPAAERVGVEGDEVPKEYIVLAVPAETVVVTCGRTGDFCPPGFAATGQDYFYLFKYTPDAENVQDRFPQMTGGDHLRLSGTRQDFDPQTGEPIVTMSFTDEGDDIFGQVTRIEAERGRRLYNLAGAGANAENFHQSFAIVLDREIRSFPSIDFQRYPTGISGSNGATISGSFTVDEAKNLALVLQTGALPVEFVTLTESQISATLGEDSLRQALQASLGGLVLVAIFLLLVYRFLGLVAVVGLGVYATFLYAVILLFNVTLTLPGFAGMILAIGVAADANIVIFERIKEESAAGKSVRAAVAAGYRKGFATIVDANVVTAITAMILFVLATGGVRGFAFLLLLGTGISIVTAVFATRALLGLLAGARWFDNPRFMGASAQRIAPWMRVDVVGRRRLWFSIAGVLIALSIAAIIFKGLNLGIDFRGGSQASFTAAQPVQVEDVRAEVQRVAGQNSVVQGKGSQTAGGFREFQIKTETLSTAEQDRLISSIEREFDAESQGVRNVSASFSEQILRSAIWAILLSFVLITIYITLRFQWRFAVPILRTIANDGLIALGVYALTGRELTAATVAAFLTIIGYSIYDTIIIFDRVRENLPIMRRATVAQIVNQSLWETVRRSLATTFITLLPVGALFFFGGETLKDFAFAILVGIGISAFSTIFIAAPFLSVLLERAPEYRGRVAVAGPGALEKDGVPATAPVVASPSPAPTPAAPPERQPVSQDGKRERRRQRRRARPHGRAR